MDIEENKRIYKYGLAVISDNKLLLCRPFAFDELIMPGGIKELNESHIQNLLREVDEELGKGAELEESSLKYIGNYEDYAAGRDNVIVEIELYSGIVNGKLIPSTEIKELIWFSTTDNQELLSPIIKNKILPALLKKKLLK